MSKKTKATLFATDATEPETQAQQLRLAQTESLGTQAVSEPQQSLSTVHSAESEDTKLVGTESAKTEFDEVVIITVIIISSVCSCAYVRAYMLACVHTCMHVCIHACVCLSVCLFVCTYILNI